VALKAVRVFVSGTVQSVGFRAFARNKVHKLGLKGFVRNLPDGRVGVVAEGKEEELKKFLSYLRQGSSLSKVKDVEYFYSNHRGIYENFKISYY